MSGVSSRGLLAVAVVLSMAACFVPGDGARSGPKNAIATSTAPLSTTECTARCEEHARSCEGAADALVAACHESCQGRLSRAAIRCVEALACSAAPAAVQQCVAANPETAAPTHGVFGDACQCPAGALECAANCGEGLSCVGPSAGTAASCIGPVCCEGAACADQLGKADHCGAGRTCGCPSGAASCDRGLCVVDH